MSLWQLTVIAFLAVIATLTGALLVYARVLTGKIGSANATLKRLEEALLRTDIPEERVPAAASEPTQSPEVPVPDRDGSASYLTVRDLKVISRVGRRSGESNVALNPVSREALSTSGKLTILTTTLATTTLAVSAESSGSGAALDTSSEVEVFPDGDVVTGELVAERSESRETPEMGGELQISSKSGAVNEESVAAISESREAPAPASSGEPQGSSGSCVVDTDLIERRKRDALVILSNQRRRRRARGY
jgi:hypothetical protein